MEYLFSVIIPTYNSEKTLDRLFNSIVNTFRGNEHLIEILFVDDGSTDQTVTKINKIINEFTSFSVKGFHSKHVGVSGVRNIGIENSNGKYLTFLDSDDEFIKCNISSLQELAKNNSNLIWLNCTSNEDFNLSGEKIKISILSRMSITGKESIDASIHGKFYLSSFIKNNKIRFDVQLRKGEDVIFNFDCIRYATTLLLTDSLLYKQNASSSVHLFDSYNVVNEVNFRKHILEITSLFPSSKQAKDVKTRFGITGVIFLLECYYSPLVREGSVNKKQAVHDIKNIIKEGAYDGFESSKFDNSLSKRGKIFRRLINMKMFGIVIFLLNAEDKAKGIKRI
ncbi:glycosyltransferase family 2 protein [Liquorilactobacillus hordei]|uniref:N-acetylglucosaminyltransferase n=1 Tax=Liquorilactobacillus hordei DSM 19519 TaxID=1423759 RepID=A0A0R1MSY1_9LACO|nr:glycosyltransferase family 2 protein [Liquorilactobacillus hordei]KRL06808.1 N-acetylglucosaminyltransferase [Liquorilactobacillus hordei DSM 19519]QYH51489.1 glycosyltransferase family 2 protein [Liquorilactobacillus hordei DSM 19519]